MEPTHGTYPWNLPRPWNLLTLAQKVTIDTVWKIVAPDRLSYRVNTGEQQVIIGDIVVAGLIGLSLVIGNWIFDRESILTRLG